MLIIFIFIVLTNSMRVRLLSDIHLEINPKIIVNFKNNADVAILAGDIGNPFDCSYDKFLMMMSLTHEKVFIVSGNHEYYNNNIKLTDNKISELCNDYDNVHFLQKSTYLYKGVNFIGTTLWSNPSDPTLCKYLNDFSKINELTYEKYLNKHLNHKEWLLNELNDLNNTQHINFIITHHLPLKELIDDEYKDSPMNSFYATNINNTGANYWCYGHTHKASYHKINNIEYHCNPKGYHGQTTGFNSDYIFEINTS